jgi:hypothetical protein
MNMNIKTMFEILHDFFTLMYFPYMYSSLAEEDNLDEACEEEKEVV